MIYLMIFLLTISAMGGARVVSGAELPPPGTWKAVDNEYVPFIAVSNDVRRYRVCSAEGSKRKIKVVFDSIRVDLLAGTCVDGAARRVSVSTEGRGIASGTYQNID
ncbi:MAG: hypothetical protein GTO40_08605 [Deltaproteobacteria bacterium]|nr:hypothetical protein [Deltaproteobacteria bacterium]